MTASGFRAFFPPNSIHPGHTQQPSQMPPLIPNMRFLAQKLENPAAQAGFFASNFPQQMVNNPNETVEEDGNEVSTSSNLASPSQAFCSQSEQSHNLDHGNESGKQI